MAILRAQVILPYFTNLPEDVIVNQFHFLSVGISTSTAATQIASRLFNFYAAAMGSAANRVSYINWGLCLVKVVDLADPTPRIPEVRTMVLSAGTHDSPIPTEVAAVMSFHAAPASGVPFQRLYNRIYLGGIPSTYMIPSTSSNFPRFLSTFITQIQNAAIGLKAANTVDLLWRQVSNAGGVLVDRNIVGGWVDNSPDTQRRRSVLATARNPFVLP